MAYILVDLELSEPATTIVNGGLIRRIHGDPTKWKAPIGFGWFEDLPRPDFNPNTHTAFRVVQDDAYAWVLRPLTSIEIAALEIIEEEAPTVLGSMMIIFSTLPLYAQKLFTSNFVFVRQLIEAGLPVLAWRHIEDITPPPELAALKPAFLARIVSYYPELFDEDGLPIE
jgi:hypothetical protein